MRGNNIITADYYIPKTVIALHKQGSFDKHSPNHHRKIGPKFNCNEAAPEIVLQYPATAPGSSIYAEQVANPEASQKLGSKKD